jgi:Holliday junction resolvasome RuvABC endonuclease subunit
MESLETKARVWLGADPGLLGAIAVVDWPRLARTFPLRLYSYDGLFKLICDLRTQYDIVFAFVEKVRPMPFHMRGPIAAVKLSQSYGAIKMALEGNGIRVDEYEPQRWQRLMGCLTGGDKRITLERARKLFPKHPITHQTADALLLAYLCQQRSRSPELLAWRPAEIRHKIWRKWRP